MINDSDRSTTLRLMAKIVIAHTSNNSLPAAHLPDFIHDVFRTLAGLPPADVPVLAMKAPVVPVTKSVFPDFIICLEDGRRLKMLKRHLRARYGLTPDAYRAKWGLPESYPMVAPTYSEHRANIARSIGRGHAQTAASAPKQVKAAAKGADRAKSAARQQGWPVSDT